MPLAVRIQRGEPPALRVGHLEAQPCERLLHDPTGVCMSRGLPQLHADSCEQRVVVEHLLEVRDQPHRIHGVAMESAPQLIVQPALRHPLERVTHEPQPLLLTRARPEAQQHVEQLRLRELRCATEPAGAWVVAVPERPRGLHPARRGESSARARRSFGRGVDLLERARTLEHRLAPMLPGLRHRHHHAPERGHAVAILGRIVRATVERHSLRREEHRHRPAPVTGDGLHGLHVDGVDVRALFTIDLHVHEQVVHDARGGLILERLVRHHVTPVTRGVPDAEQDRLVLGHRARKGLRPPRVPVDGVLRVLLQVGAGFCCETIRHGYIQSTRRAPPSPCRASTT